jgi:restriction system protein
MSPNDVGETPSVPRYNELMWPALQALRAMGGSATNEELLAKVIEIAAIPPAVQAIQHTDHRQSRVNYNLAWAKSYLKAVGAIENSSRGVWSLTDVGEHLTQEDVVHVPARVRRQSAAGKRVREPTGLENGAPAPLDGEAVEAVEPHWKDDLLGILRELTPSAFERLSQRLLREAGFIKVEVTGRSGDGGIDGIGVLRVNCFHFRSSSNASDIKAASAPARCAIFVARWWVAVTKGCLSQQEHSRPRRNVRRPGTEPLQLI